jgi:hypothetical protein
MKKRRVKRERPMKQSGRVQVEWSHNAMDARSSMILH